MKRGPTSNTSSSIFKQLSKGNSFYAALSDFGIDTNYVRLPTARSDVSKPFDTKRGLQQGQKLQCGCGIRTAEINTKSIMLS